MSNMSYIRFENTLSDFKDCVENLALDLNAKDERVARSNLIMEAVALIESLEIEEIFETPDHWKRREIIAESLKMVDLDGIEKDPENKEEE